MVALICLWGCRTGESGRKKSVKTDNGLTVSIPEEGYEAEKTAAGLRIRPANWRSLREPTEISVEIRDNAPAGDFGKRRRVGDREALYRVDTATGGSGGEEQTLHAYVSAPSGIIYLRQTAQSEEPADLNFNLGWQILETARIEK
jgi:hypothetical protein